MQLLLFIGGVGLPASPFPVARMCRANRCARNTRPGPTNYTIHGTLEGTSLFKSRGLRGCCAVSVVVCCARKCARIEGCGGKTGEESNTAPGPVSLYL